MPIYQISDDHWSKLLSFLRSYARVYVGQKKECYRFMEGVFWVMCTWLPMALFAARIWQVKHGVQAVCSSV